MTDPAFRKLRLRLTGLYFAAMVGFLVLIGSVSYGLINFYFQSSTDLALRYKMAYEHQLLGLPIPADLQSANQEWDRLRGQSPTPGAAAGTTDGHDSDDDKRGDDRKKPPPQEDAPIPREAAEGELAAIGVLPLDAQGRHIVSGAVALSSPFLADAAAAQAALRNGSDLRTIQSSSGQPVRLFSYRLPANQTAAVLQLGRVLTDQVLILRQLLTGMLGAGGVLAVLATLSAWWLAGRSLRPTQQAWERQRGFVASASHELRTPLSLIQLSAEVATRDDTSDDERRELAGDVLRESRYMARLVSDLLLLSRLDAGQLALDLQRVAVPELLCEVQHDVARLAEERGISLEVRESGGAVLADRLRLRQALLAVLDNALRHTPAGGRVTLSAAARGRSADIVIADTGAGIPPEHLPRLFERFYQADPSHTSKGSAGLGLAIARSLVEAMRGHIGIASEVGQGTRVTFTLPAAEGPA